MKNRQKSIFLNGERDWLCIGAVSAFSCHAQSFKTKKGSKVHCHFYLQDSNLYAEK
uniref:hypothetical protein n=1 Tax=Bacillus cytotoxicus TaxID=580165 RepID=UPI00203F47BE